MSRAVVGVVAWLGAAGPAMAWEGNPYDAQWDGDLPWRLANNGSARLTDLGQVEQILVRSYETWEAPVCTDFRHDYGGRTSARSNRSDGVTVHGFLSSWPRALGDVNSVIGITESQYSGFSSFDIVEADVSFNEAGFRFVVGTPSRGTDADLQSIATHEFGHSLGLGHSTARSATMFATYDNATNQRTLTGDDIDGVCAYYPSGTSQPRDDAYEENDDPNQATPLRCGDALTAVANDDDWFVTATPLDAEVELSVDPVAGGLAVQLFRRQGSQLADLDALSPSGGNLAATTFSSPASGEVYTVVSGSSGTEYTITADCTFDDDAREDNDRRADAVELDCPGTYDLIALEGDADWFSFASTGRGNVRARVEWTDADATLALRLLDDDGAEAEIDNVTATSARARFDDVRSGTFVLRVDATEGVAAAYSLNLVCSAGDASDDRDDDPVDDRGASSLDDDEDEDDSQAIVRQTTCGCALGAGSGGWALPWLFATLFVRRRQR